MISRSLARQIIWITLIEQGVTSVEAFTNPVVVLKRTVVTSKISHESNAVVQRLEDDIIEC